MHELRNHTPHPISVVLPDGRTVDLPPCPPTPRCLVTRTPAGAVETVHGVVPLTRTALADGVVDLPEQSDGVLLVVARGVVEARPERADLVFPDDLVRDDQGRVVACRALGRADGIDVAALLTWVNLPAWEQSQSFLEEHPALVDPRAVAELYRQTAVQPRPTQVLRLDDHAWLLRLCLEQGIADGYATYHRVVAGARRRDPEADDAELRHTLTGDRAALDTALEIRQEIDVLVAATSRSRVRAARVDLARLLLRRYLRDGRENDLDQAVAAADAAMQVPGAVPRTRAVVTELLARALRMRVERRGPSAGLDRLLAVVDDALDALPDDSSTLPGLWAVQGEALRLRYAATGDPAYLDRAVDTFQRAESWTAAVAARRPALLGDLGTGLVERHRLRGEVDDLDRGVAALDAAVAGTPAASPDRVAHAVNLAATLLLRHDRSGDPADLDRAQALLEDAERALGSGSPLRPAVHGALATCLRVRYTRTGDMRLLDRAVDQAEQAVATSPAPAVAASHRAQLGHLLVARAQRSAELPPERRGDDVADLARAVDSYERALAATPPGVQGWAERAASLGIGLAERYLRTGAVADLDRGLEMLQAAVRATPPTSVNAAGDLFNLGNVLWIRYGRTRRLDDLDAALSALQRAADATPPRSTDRPGCLNSLAVALSERYGRTGAVADLDECARLLRGAAAAAPAGTPDHTVVVTNLGNALRMQARVRDSDPLRAEAVAVLRSALQTAREAGLPRAGASHNLASTLLVAVGGAPDDAALSEALDLLTEAVSLTPADAVDLPRYRAGLGRALRIRFTRTRDADDYRRGTGELAAAGRAALDVDLELAVDAARLGAQWAAAERDPTTAAAAFRTVLTGLRRLVTEQAVRPHQEVWLRQGGDLAAGAALTFVQAPDGDAREAAVALEQGRAFLLGEALDLRATALERLAADAPALAARFRSAAERVAVTRGAAVGTTSLSRPTLRPAGVDGGAQ